MTTSNWNKTFKQLKHKPFKLKKYKKHNAPRKRTVGIARKACRRCGRNRAHIGSYSLNMCRQCFREIATKIGFKKFS